MKISQILKELNLTFVLVNDIDITNVAAIQNITNNCVSFIDSDKNFDKYSHLSSYYNLIILNLNFLNYSIKLGNYIYAENPKYTFIKIFNLLYPSGINDEEAILMGENIKIGKNCNIKNCIIENNVTIHDNCSIGQSGFGYIKTYDEIVQFPHIGKVYIKEGVTIHSNVCIDRGSLGNTVIHKNCKIDNLVHIAHNVEIGENTYIIAGSVIGGSTKIGKNCWISPGSVIRDNIIIGNNVLIGLGSVILNNVPNNEIWFGNPGKKRKE